MCMPRADFAGVVSNGPAMWQAGQDVRSTTACDDATARFVSSRRFCASDTDSVGEIDFCSED